MPGHDDVALGVGELLDLGHALVADEDVAGVEERLAVFLGGVGVAGLATAFRAAGPEHPA